jgi:hypothetical protein
MFLSIIHRGIYIAFVAVFLLAGCSDDITVTPEPSPFDGVWQEVFYIDYGLDPGDFILLDSNFIIDSNGFYDPPEPIIVDSIIYRNDSVFVVDTSGDYYFAQESPLISVIEFTSDSFNIMIEDQFRMLKELAGRFQVHDSVIKFNVNYCWYAYWDRFLPGHNICGPRSDSLYFRFLDKNSLKLRVIEIVSDSGLVTVPLAAAPWYVPPFMRPLKIEGVFTRRN